MKLPWPAGINSRNRSIFVVGFLLGLIFIVGTAILMLENPNPKSGPAAQKSTSAQSNRAQSANGSNAQKQSQGNHGTTDPSSNIPVDTNENNNEACRLLSLSAAKSLIGQSTKVTQQDETDSTDILTVTCSYGASDGSSLKLQVHIAKTDLGKSQNDTAFGSEKPSGVTDIQGYGQAAYWDGSADKLHVLSQNDWYIISRSPGASLQQTETVADAIDPKL